MHGPEVVQQLRLSTRRGGQLYILSGVNSATGGICGAGRTNAHAHRRQR